MGIAEFLAFGDVVNVVLREEAFPFVNDPEDRHNNRPRNGLQGRVLFADSVGLHVLSHGGRCMPLFAEDSMKIEDNDLKAHRGTFFPWHSVISVIKITDPTQYESDWRKHERDQEAFSNANGSWPESSGEFYRWRNSLSQAAYDAAFGAPRPD